MLSTCLWHMRVPEDCSRLHLCMSLGQSGCELII